MISYRGWQFSEKEPISESVKDALDNYIKRNGLPKQILLETGIGEELPLPEGLNIVVRVVDLPRNVLLVGKLE